MVLLREVDKYWVNARCVLTSLDLIWPLQCFRYLRYHSRKWVVVPSLALIDRVILTWRSESFFE